MSFSVSARLRTPKYAALPEDEKIQVVSIRLIEMEETV